MFPGVQGRFPGSGNRSDESQAIPPGDSVHPVAPSHTELQRWLTDRIRTMLRDRAGPEDVEDLVQEVWIKVLRGIHNCRATRSGEFFAWVGTVAKREVLDFLAGQQRRGRPIERANALPTITGFSDVRGCSISQATDRECPLLRTLRAELSRADDELHHLIRRRIVLGLSWPEVGRELRISPAAAKRRWQRFVGSCRASRGAAT